MRYMKLITLLIFGACFTSLPAQETIPASGSNATGSQGSVSYTIGQVAYSTNTNANGSVTQGVQQPFEISIVSGIDDAANISLIMEVYPNPTTDFIKLVVNDYESDNLSYKLYDINGKPLMENQVIGTVTSIPMGNLMSGTYFLKINENRKEIKIFKIIKY